MYFTETEALRELEILMQMIPGFQPKGYGSMVMPDQIYIYLQEPPPPTYQEMIADTMHAVYSRQRVDEFQESKVAGTESARQYKDATDLICQPEVNRNLIRRLTPLECERLQGFPDGWTLIDGASDSARYKALGNSVAIPCVTFVLRGIVLIMEKEFAEEQKN